MTFFEQLGKIYLSYYVIAAMAAGVICCLLRRKRYHMTVLQTLFLCFMHAIFGNIGDRVTARIALGEWGGACWYGVPLMIMISIFLLSKIMKRPFGEIGDMSAAGICSIHIVSKIACIFQGCCTGIVLWTTSAGTAIHFPCREFEIITNAVILIALLRFERKGIAKGMLWEIYTIWYAMNRYISAWLREFKPDWKPFVLWIPAARFWTIMIILVGILLLVFHFIRKYKREPSFKELIFAIFGKLPAVELKNRTKK